MVRAKRINLDDTKHPAGSIVRGYNETAMPSVVTSLEIFAQHLHPDTIRISLGRFEFRHHQLLGRFRDPVSLKLCVHADSTNVLVRARKRVYTRTSSVRGACLQRNSCVVISYRCSCVRAQVVSLLLVARHLRQLCFREDTSSIRTVTKCGSRRLVDTMYYHPGIELCPSLRHEPSLQS